MADSLRPSVVPISDSTLPLQLGVATFSRFLLNTARRFPYPFAPALSRGLGVPLQDITSLIAINQLSGILSPLFGPLSDRWGYRTMMLVSLSICAVGLLLGGAVPLYSTVLLAMLLAGIGNSVLYPAFGAYVGERVPYHRRGLVIGLIELSWSGASLIGIPVTGLLIAWYNWRAPFLALGSLMLLSMLALSLLLPRNTPATATSRPKVQMGQSWGLLLKSRAAIGVLISVFLTAMANDNLFVTYGAWLENSFALGVVALGAATTVIGVAELIGEVLTATVSDRLGLKRAAIGGALLTTLSYTLLPFMNQSLTLALIGLFIIFLIFEFTVVTTASILTELLPEARATLLSAMMAASGLGRVSGALLGGEVWVRGELPAIGLISTLLSGIGFAFFLWGLWQWRVDERLHN